MGDYDNTREDRHNEQLERGALACQESIDYHADNWMTAVTKSVEKSSGTFKDVTDYDAAKKLPLDLSFPPYPKRSANSVDVFIEELHHSDFMERAARILISIQSNNANPQADVSKLCQDMAQSYAEFQYESNIKD